MAQKRQVLLIDDVDGSTAEENIRFSVGGADYEMDLSAENAAKFRDDLAPWIGAARKVSGRRGRTRRATPGTSTADRHHTRAVRDWAREQGLKVSDRGRIPSDILRRYEEAHG